MTVSWLLRAVSTTDRWRLRLDRLARSAAPRHARAMRPLVLLIVSLALACGGRAPPHGERLEAYPATRFIPSDATYAFTATSADAAFAVVRDLADGFGPAAGVDAAALGALVRDLLGFDALSGAGWAELGVDLTGGAALWASSGVSAVLAVRLDDPQRLAAFVDTRKARGLVLSTSALDGREVTTIHGDDGVALSWAVVDRWLLVHAGLSVDRAADGAWLRAALSAGGRFAGTTDFADALTAARARLNVTAPPVIGVVRPDRVLAGPAGVELDDCRALLGHARRVLFALASEPTAARGALTIELDDAAAGIAEALTPAPVGWAAARGDAPLVVEVGLDLRRAQAAIAPCMGDRVLAPALAARVWAGRAFAHQLDLEAQEARGAVATLAQPGLIDRALSQLPGRSLFTSHRRVGGLEVATLKVPTMPTVSYAERGEELTITAEMPIDDLLERGVSDELLRLELRPRAWSAEALDSLLGLLVGRDRLRSAMVAGLRRWSHGRLTVRLEASAIVVEALGQR